MVGREDISKGQTLRLLSDSFDVSKGTLATVETVGTLKDGTWVFTVRWDNHTALSRGKSLQPMCSRC